MADPTGYVWDAVARRYRTAAGKLVSESKVRAALDDAMNATAERMGRLARGLTDGDITVDQWHAGMRESLRRMHTCATALAQGGWAQVSPSEWGHAGAAVKEQLRYLSNFANQLAAGTQRLDGRFLARASMYASSGHGTYEESKRRRETAAGMTEERRLTTALESCEECLAVEAQGWQPIGTLPAVGTLSCLVNCRCEWEYRGGSGGVGQRIPDAESIKIATEKVPGYFFNFKNTRGWVKGNFFKRYGFTEDNPGILEAALLDHGRSNPVVLVEKVEPARRGGVKWNVRGPLVTPDGRNPIITTAWKRDEGEDYPHFVTATFKKDNKR